MGTETLLEEKFRLTQIQKGALKKLGLQTVRDLLLYFPSRYGDVAHRKSIRDLQKGDYALVYGRVKKLEMKKAFRKKIPMAEGVIEDETGELRVVWFHQPYIAKMLKEGALVALKGKISEGKRGLSLINPDSEGGVPPEEGVGMLFDNESSNEKKVSLQPVYPETRGITSRWFYYTIKKIISERAHEKLSDELPDEILKKYHLPTLSTALVWIHMPQKAEDAAAARKRFAFEEIFFIQLARLRDRKSYEENPTFQIIDPEKGRDEFVKRFPFSLTNAQERAIQTIVDNFKKEKPMSRLLEGDVGSGKTAVAAAGAYAIVTSRPKGQNFGNLQAAIMAPTEILAKQHFDSFISCFSHLPIQIGLITGTGCKKFPSKVNPQEATDIPRSQLLKWVANGEIPILVGTHALIQKSVRFKHLAFVVIDEQHRFGTMQRFKLARKEGPVPHLLSMTATPIPRTLALTIYGDLDLTLLDEMPAGRKPIQTEIIPEHARNGAYEAVRKELREGRQAYVICPRIDEPDPKKFLAMNATSVKKEAARLKKDVFPDYEIGILHSKMTPSLKDSVMSDFAEGKIHILVATSVVEVGVNVPNATTIIIEGAERFGLAQLHQLRGRVLRSTHQAYCHIFADTKSKKSLERLRALTQAKNGFELAELDLKLRGAGELSGRKQWGLSDVGMEAIKNIKMVEAAREEAQKLLEEDSLLEKYPLIQDRLAHEKSTVHFE